MARSKKAGKKRKSNPTEETKASDSNDSSNAKQQKVERPVLKLSTSEEPITKSTILPNTKGFLISFTEESRHCRRYCSVVKGAITLLNEYADKLYRTDRKTCCFEQKLPKGYLSNDRGLSPVFIETDVEDPAVLANAILEDMKRPSFDIKKVEHWSRFVPVNVTCNAVSEEIIQKAKNVLQPLFQNSEATKIPNVDKMIKSKRLKMKIVNAVKADLKEYMRSQSLEAMKKSTDSGLKYLDVYLDLWNLEGVCCISLLDSAKTYSITGIGKKSSETALEVNHVDANPTKDNATIESMNDSKADQKAVD